MPDSGTNYEEQTGLDALSDVLRVLRLTGGVFLDARFTAPWCVRSRAEAEDWRRFVANPAQVFSYHYLVSGRIESRRLPSRTNATS